MLSSAAAGYSVAAKERKITANGRCVRCTSYINTHFGSCPAFPPVPSCRSERMPKTGGRAESAFSRGASGPWCCPRICAPRGCRCCSENLGHCGAYCCRQMRQQVSNARFARNGRSWNFAFVTFCMSDVTVQKKAIVGAPEGYRSRQRPQRFRNVTQCSAASAALSTRCLGAVRV